jgi:dipeptidyl aminopeptidase/acylaminoacyl peptidase
MKKILLLSSLLIAFIAHPQERMTPELLWKLGRVSGSGLSKDGKYVIYTVGTPDIEENIIRSKAWMIPVTGGTAMAIENTADYLLNEKISPDGKYILTTEQVKLQNVLGSEIYPELSKANALSYASLNYRHWDEWEDGKYNHIFLSTYNMGTVGPKTDLMPGELYDSPLKPFGGSEDYVWSPDSRYVVYAALKKSGTEYATSTNTDLYQYDILSGATKNLTGSNKGYDRNPSFNNNGTMAWLQMKRDGFEADKEDIIITTPGGHKNLTAHRDDIHVVGYKWSLDGKHIFFWAPTNGTLQLFEVEADGSNNKNPRIRQMTKGDFDINKIIGQAGDKLIVSRTDMNHAAELFSVSIASGDMQQLTRVNDAVYKRVASSKTERRWVTTTDNKKMLVWVIYPPDFDPQKKYAALLYCQGGPQSPLTQSYSFRWNFHLMASQGYIVVAPNRRGMPGHGTKWNEAVSRDWGGQMTKDYLSAIDAVRKEKYVDNKKIGAVGASAGGFSVFSLAGLHNGRFKTFIAHAGVFDLRSMYGSTEEVFFTDWDLGRYWDKKDLSAQRAYSQSPSNYVEKWNTPIMIIQGGRDYRVPQEQAFQAFQAAQLKGINSKLLYFPEENHWILKPQNGLVWQREFFKWLDETMK